ncbi:MAG: hypothetical protein KGZ65_04360 [Sphingomonadales bacterium]|nr:hypothetical protein [Sphingomonadaceae bacterium]MBS3930447.1 hypothetical protein [Sphingomonadales bacterium]
MPEIGSGGGSGYPAAIDSDATLETNADYARIQVPNDLAACIVAIETELGIAPSGGYATVVARLDTLSNTSGGVPRGANSARPAASAGTFYLSTDLGIFEYSDGTNWFPIL